MDKLYECLNGRMSCWEEEHHQLTMKRFLNGYSAWEAVFGHKSKPKHHVPAKSCPSVYHWLLMSISTWDSLSWLKYISFFTVINTSSQLVITVKSYLVSSATINAVTHRFRWQLPSPSGFCSCLGLGTGAVQTLLWETMGQTGHCAWVVPGVGRMFLVGWRAQGVCGRNVLKWTRRRKSNCQYTLPSLTSHLSWLDKMLCAWAHWPVHIWQSRRRPWLRSAFLAQQQAASETCAKHHQWSDATEMDMFPQDILLFASAETPRKRHRPAELPPRGNCPSAYRRPAHRKPTRPDWWSPGSLLYGWHDTPLAQCRGWYHSPVSHGSPRAESCQSQPVWCGDIHGQTRAHFQVWHPDVPGFYCA